MRITNESPFAAGWSVGFSPSAREVAVVAVKGTFSFPSDPGQAPFLAAEQRRLVESDVFGADPAYDAPVRENDFALFKPQCDVLLNATAYAPQGRPATRVDVGVRVGSFRKTMSVVGERQWYWGVGGPKATMAAAFTQQAISYDVAFGGIDVDPNDPTRIETFVENPVGEGFCRFEKSIEGRRLPATEQPGAVVSDPALYYRPMAFGPLGRNWAPRYSLAGTYDDRWLNDKVPFLPDDFDYRYFQAAPDDQRIPYPSGGEPVVLVNLTPKGRVETSLPAETVWVTLIRTNGHNAEVQATLDTIVIEPDDSVMTLTWRAGFALHRDPFEIREMVVERGEDRTPAKSRARLAGKRYVSNLNELPARPPGRRS